MSAQQIVKTVIQYSYPLTNDERNFLKLRKDIKKITLYTSAANVKTYYENLKKL